MAGDDKKSKSAPKEKPSVEAKSTDKTPAEVPAKAEVKTEAAAPSSYARGEGQKPVSQAYKDNWNAIYAKKKKR